MDGVRQDSIDLFLGLYDVASDGTVSPFEDARTLRMRLVTLFFSFSNLTCRRKMLNIFENQYPLLLAFSLMMLFLTFFLHFGIFLFGCSNSTHDTDRDEMLDTWSNRVGVTLFWVGVAYVCVRVIMTNGLDFVDKPRLRTPAYLARRTQIPPFASRARVIAGDNAMPSIGIAQVKKADLPADNTTFKYTDGKTVRF